jgi:hypothetical protein
MFDRSAALCAAAPDAPASEESEPARRRLCKHLHLLVEARVQRELRLTEPQIDEIRGLHREETTKQLALRLAMDGSREPRQADGPGDADRLRDETRKAMMKVLEAPQRARFRQLALQAVGVRAFKEEDVAAALNLTDEQKQRQAKADQTYDEEAQTLLDACRAKTIHPGLYPEKIGELKNQHRQSLDAVLTDAQRARLQALRGDPFDFDNAASDGGRAKPGSGTIAY